MYYLLVFVFFDYTTVNKKCKLKIIFKKTKKGVDFFSFMMYYNNRPTKKITFGAGDGGIAQLARAFGSYPKCRWFKSDCRYHKWPVGQAVKTPPFHGGNTSSILVQVTILEV